MPSQDKKNKNVSPSQICSLIDVFPTIFHILTKQEDFSDLFEGQSIFHSSKREFSLAANQNGNKAPKAFVLYYQNQKIFLNLIKTDNKPVLEITDIKDLNNKSLTTKNLTQNSFDFLLEKPRL